MKIDRILQPIKWLHQPETNERLNSLGRVLLALLLCLIPIGAGIAQSRVLIPMDAGQTNHLKAYGLMFQHLATGETGTWLLNYRGGSFLTTNRSDIVRNARIRNVRVELLSESQAQALIREVESQGANTAAVNLEKVPKIAVYTPPQALPWDDAVTLALDYAEVPYEKLYDREVLRGDLAEYDWLHLHHKTSHTAL